MTIKDTLLYKTIFSTDLNLTDSNIMFNGKTRGTNNKKTLTERIKKLEQSDRRDLKTYLDQIGRSLKAELLIQDPLLPEKGICVLLLTDSGTYKQDWGWLGDFARSFNNLFFDRIGSESLVDQIEGIQRAEVNPVFTALDYHEIVPSLTQKHAQLSQHFETKVSIKKKACSAENPEVWRTKQFVTGLGQLRDKLSVFVNYLADTLNESSSQGFSFTDSASVFAAQLLPIFADPILSNYYSGILKDLRSFLTKINSIIIDPNTLNFTDECAALKDLECLPKKDKEEAEALYSCFLNNAPLDDRKKERLLRLFYVYIFKTCSALHAKVKKTVLKQEGHIADNQETLRLLDKRKQDLDIYFNNIQQRANQQRAEAAQRTQANQAAIARQSQVTATNAQLSALQKDENAINHLLQEVTRFKKFQFDPNQIVVYLQTKITHLEIPAAADLNVDRFRNHLIFINNLLVGNSEAFGHVENPIQPQYFQVPDSTSQDKKDKINDLQTYLQLRTQQQMHSISPENKTTFFKNCFEYIELYLSTDLKLLKNRREELYRQIQAVQRAPASAFLPQQQPGAIQQQGGDAQGAAAAPQQMPIHFGMHQQHLSGLANYLTTTPSDHASIPGLFDNLPLRDFANDVYHNFYFLMLKNNQIGHEHCDWGKCVFKGENLNNLLRDVPSALAGTKITTEQLNAYRIRAIRLAAQGRVSGVADARLG